MKIFFGKLIRVVLPVVIFASSCDDDEVATSPERVFEVLNVGSDATFTDVSFADENRGVICGSSGFIAKTIDGGATWTQLNTGVTISFLKCQFANDGTIYSARHGLYGSTDDGKSFFEIGEFSNFDNTIKSIHFFNANEGLITKGNLAIKTEDGGANWAVKFRSTLPIEMQVLSRNFMVASGGATRDGSSFARMDRSLDGGETWHQLDGLPATWEVLSFHFIDNNRGFLYNINNEFYKTVDGGNTWSLVSDISGVPDLLFNLYFIDAENGFATTITGHVLETNDGGHSWKSIYTTQVSILRITVAGNTLYCVGSDGFVLRVKNLLKL